jgi:hypothetical protein
MEFFSKLLSSSDDLDDVQKKYERKVAEYEKNKAILNEAAISLYSLRKEALKKLQLLDSYVSNLNQCPRCILKSTKRALDSAAIFRSAWEFDDAAVNKSAESMAIATTFGTADEGSAISSLGGAASASAAFSLLGSGAGIVAAGLIPIVPVGLIGAAIMGVLALSEKANDLSEDEEAILKINRQISSCGKATDKLKSLLNQVKVIRQRTIQLMNEIDLGNFIGKPNDFESIDFPRSQLFEAVSNSKKLGKIIAQPANVK